MKDHVARLLLPPSPGSVAEGRRWARALAQLAGADPAAEGVLQLLTSEVLTNAIVHTRTQHPITVTMRRIGEGAMRVSVTDPDTTLPIVRPERADRPGGNGMRIVDALSQNWGVELHPGVGKTVWFDTALRDEAAAELLSA